MHFIVMRVLKSNHKSMRLRNSILSKHTKLASVYNKKYNEQYSNKQNTKSSYNSKYVYSAMLALSLFGLTSGLDFVSKRTRINTQSWGVIGYVGQDPIAESIVLDGIQILQYRGYDSWGICTVNDDGNFVIHKKASIKGEGGDCIQNILRLAEGKHNHKIGLGHTRWATHGGKTDQNAHPHFDLTEQLVVVHNGMIENYTEIRDELNKKGIKQKSETDTELIALYTKYLIDSKNLTTEEAFRECWASIQGSNCCLLMDRKQPDRIFAAKSAGSLLIGIGEKGFVISSQVSAFQQYTRNYVQVPNNEVCIITKDEIIKKGKQISKSDIKTLRREIIDKVPKPGYKWFLEQEIWEQPEAVSKTLNYGGRIAANNRVKLGGLDSREDDLKAIDNLVIGAWGTSLHAGMYGALMLRKFQCFNSITPVTASDITADYFAPKNTGLLSITQSGETEDLKKVIRIAQPMNRLWFNIVNEVESEIARMTELGIFLNSGREVSVASTKAFTCQCIAMCLVTAWFAEKKSPNKMVFERIELIENLKLFVMKLQCILNDLRFEIKDLAQEIKDKNYMVVLGKGLCEPIAREAALKIKEVTYIHWDAYSSGEFKHGPISLIEEGKKWIGVVYLLDDENFEYNKSMIEQLNARGAYTIVITDCRYKLSDDLADKFIKIPSWGDLTPVLGIIPMQLLTLYIAQMRGNDVDQPRNLAKTVTV